MWRLLAWRSTCGTDVGCAMFAHAGMNEATWQRVKVWEILHRQECAEARLLRFQGKPHDLRWAHD